MKVSVYGCGSIGQRHLKNLDKIRDELGISELACFDQNVSRAESLMNSISQLKICKNIEEASIDCDVAFVCVPTSLHVPIINEIFNNSIPHIYLEKPFSHTIAGCDEIMFNMNRNKKYLSVGYMLPKHPVIQELKKIIESGTIGKPLSVRAESGFYLPLWHPEEDYRDFYMSWKTGGGGALLDTSHEINYLQYIFGDIESVSGEMRTISDLEISSDDLAVGTFTFKNGMIGQVHLDLLQYEEERYSKTIGSKGVVIASLVKNQIQVFEFESKEWKKIDIKVEFDNIYFDQLRDFWKSIREGKSYLIDGDEAIKTMHVVEAIRQSSITGNRLRLPLF